VTVTHGRSDIFTISGTYFDYLDPEHSEFTIHTIAHHLSNLCRFAGATIEFYSVAQHCVLVSHLVPTPHALAGLLHDATEAFMVDIPRPLKLLLPDYKTIEARVERAVLARFGLPYPMATEVHYADRVALFIEQRDLMAPHDHRTWQWIDDLTDDPGYPVIEPAPPKVARELFLARYAELTGSR
jgi:hypothetical protein